MKSVQVLELELELRVWFYAFSWLLRFWFFLGGLGFFFLIVTLVVVEVVCGFVYIKDRGVVYQGFVVEIEIVITV